MGGLYIVSGEPGGRWSVRQEGSDGASRVYDDRDSALTAAAEMARANPPCRVRVVGPDGRVETEKTYTAQP